MPKAKKKPLPDGGAPAPGVQWAPISTLNRAAMMPQPAPSTSQPPPAPAPAPPASSSSSAFPSPSSEGPPSAPPTMLRGTDLRVNIHHQQQQPPVLPSNAPPLPSAGSGHHHHYIPPPTSSGRGTPTPSQGPISNYGGGGGPGRAPFPHHHHTQAATALLPSIESPGPGQGGPRSTGRRTPAGARQGQGHGEREGSGMQPVYSSFKYPPPGPGMRQQHTGSARPSPTQEDTAMTGIGGGGETEHRSLTDDEVRRLHRFMSLNWRVGVINHPPFARRPQQPHPELGYLEGPGPGPQIAGFRARRRKPATPKGTIKGASEGRFVTSSRELFDRRFLVAGEESSPSPAPVVTELSPASNCQRTPHHRAAPAQFTALAKLYQSEHPSVDSRKTLGAGRPMQGAHS
ncbi:hypothetical protein GE09DRAFT_1224109 [Coniochaeta sp. 2T2.1]|nr:hypothetical protein GE09DRAFT_1224109 [Coniochaeta sp. 2T2.1]